MRVEGLGHRVTGATVSTSRATREAQSFSTSTRISSTVFSRPSCSSPPDLSFQKEKTRPTFQLLQSLRDTPPRVGPLSAGGGGATTSPGLSCPSSGSVHVWLRSDWRIAFGSTSIGPARQSPVTFHHMSKEKSIESGVCWPPVLEATFGGVASCARGRDARQRETPGASSGDEAALRAS